MDILSLDDAKTASVDQLCRSHEALRKRVEALEAVNKRLRELAESVPGPFVNSVGNWECETCGSWSLMLPLGHKPDCLHLRAQAALRGEVAE